MRKENLSLFVRKRLRWGNSYNLINKLISFIAIRLGEQSLLKVMGRAGVLVIFVRDVDCRFRTWSSSVLHLQAFDTLPLSTPVFNDYPCLLSCWPWYIHFQCLTMHRGELQASVRHWIHCRFTLVLLLSCLELQTFLNLLRVALALLNLHSISLWVPPSLFEYSS